MNKTTSYTGIDQQKQLDAFELRNKYHLALTQVFVTMHANIAT